MTIYTGGRANNTDPPDTHCTWCDPPRRLYRESGGFYWTCGVWGHPHSHDPRRKGLKWALRAVLGLRSDMRRHRLR